MGVTLAHTVGPMLRLKGEGHSKKLTSAFVFANGDLIQSDLKLAEGEKPAKDLASSTRSTKSTFSKQLSTPLTSMV